MQKANYQNEIIKRDFASFLKNSEGFSEESVASFEAALLLWEDFNFWRDFEGFDQKQAVAFRDWLKSKRKKGSEKTISLSYCYDNLRRLRRFFEWLSKQPKSKINPTHIGFLNLSKKENRIATQTRDRKIPTFEEVVQTIESIAGKTEVERRDRALLSLTLLTGARISAIASLPLKSFDRNRLTLEQNPAYGVKTKFSKKITTALFPLPDERPLKFFLDWFDYLQSERKFSPNDPIFPATRIEHGEENINFYSPGSVDPSFWSGSNPARKIFEKRFKNAGTPYYHPHTFRHLIVKEFVKTRLTEEEKKAISQNLGHEDVGTTFGSYGYGHIAEDRQVDLVRSIRFNNPETQALLNGMDDEVISRLADALKSKLAN
jgi:integrase/recombinase XerD